MCVHHACVCVCAGVCKDESTGQKAAVGLHEDCGPTPSTDVGSESEPDVKEEPDDDAKVAYLNAAMKDQVAFDSGRELDEDLKGVRVCVR